MSIFSDVLGAPGPRKRTLQRAMTEIGKVGAGVIVLLMPSEPEQLTREISAASGKPTDMDLRDYGIGAQILADLGIHDMVLLTNSHRNVVGIEGYGINIVGERPIPEA
jgi:3,4-dihydroxy 2-butanone 4-phosphate synthase/GTP cyclohydrolase II